MGYYVNLFAQVLRKGVWVDPFKKSDWIKSVACQRYRYDCPLVGGEPEFSLRLEIPPEFEKTELGKQLDYSFQSFSGWIPLSELKLADWKASFRLVRGSVPATMALDFGDGTLRRSFTEAELKVVRLGEKTESPINNLEGVRRSQLEKSAPSSRISVSWIASMEEMVGPDTFEALSNFSELEVNSESRIVLISCH